MKSDKILNGHLSALLTIIIWGTTFISTKILLKIFSPVEILFLRFSIGFITLLMVYPHKLKIKEKKEEIYFLSAGLCGVTLYFLFENIALIYTQASNVGVIISIAPFFTAILVHLILKNEELTKQFIIGFIAAIIGIILISFNGSFILKMNPIGDILAILAATMWAFYSVITKKISSFGYNVIQTTRRIFFYGLLFMIPVLFVSKIEIHLQEFYNLSVIFNLGYLGFGASALCFVTWNFSVKVLCAVKTSVYIYLVPVITVVTSIIILNEEITIVSAFGIALILTGLIISERKFNIKKKDGYKGNEICNDD